MAAFYGHSSVSMVESKFLVVCR